MVPAFDRNTHRRLDPLYGAGKHCWKQPRTPMDDHFWVWFGPRLWIFLRPSADTAIRGIALADVTALVQCRRRARPASGAVAAHSGSRAAFSVRRRRTHRHDHSFGNHCAYGMALDD